MTKRKVISKFLIIFMLMLLVAAMPLMSANRTTTVSADGAITDLTGTTWTIKKPSEWVYGGPVPEASGIKQRSDLFELNYTISYDEYISAVQSILGITRFSAAGDYLNGVLHSRTGDLVYPFFSIISDGDTYSASANRVDLHNSSNSEDDINLGDVEVTLNIIDGDDTDNADLITWLTANAKQVVTPTPPPGTGVVENITWAIVLTLILGCVILFVNANNKKHLNKI